MTTYTRAETALAAELSTKRVPSGTWSKTHLYIALSAIGIGGWLYYKFREKDIEEAGAEENKLRLPEDVSAGPTEVKL
jgi:hypothetical protein